MTMVVGRDPAQEEVLRTIGTRVDRETFLIAADAPLGDRRARWFGDTSTLAVLDFAVPRRSACARFGADASPFEIGQAVLHCEGQQQPGGGQ